MKKSNFFLSIFLLLVIVVIGITAYFLLIYMDGNEIFSQKVVGLKEQKNVIEDTRSIKIFYPIGLNLHTEEKEVKRIFAPLKIAEIALNEFFKKKNIVDTDIMPEHIKVLGLYLGIDKILYIDLSRDFQRSFKGDIMDEYMLLKGLYETVISNIEVDDIKLLIEGKEIETIGGHFYIKYPIKQLVSQDLRIDY